jgi:hypothetical protein
MDREPRRRALTAIDGALAIIAVLLIVQMWLLIAALESYLAGHRDTALPSAIASAVMFLGTLALYFFIVRIDRRERGEDGKQPSKR